MKYKLHYTNEFGQIVKQDGSPDLARSLNEVYSESYSDIEQAKTKAKYFLVAHPLMACIISPGENGEDQLVLSASSKDIEKALERQKCENRKLFWKAKILKIPFYIFFISLIILIIMYFVV